MKTCIDLWLKLLSQGFMQNHVICLEIDFYEYVVYHHSISNELMKKCKQFSILTLKLRNINLIPGLSKYQNAICMSQ